MSEDPNTVTKSFTSPFVLDKAKITRILDIMESRFEEASLGFNPIFEAIHIDGKKISIASVEELFSLDNTVKNPIAELSVSAHGSVFAGPDDMRIIQMYMSIVFSERRNNNVSLHVNAKNSPKLANQIFAELEEQIERTFLHSWVYKYAKSSSDIGFFLGMGAVLLLLGSTFFGLFSGNRSSVTQAQAQAQDYKDDQYFMEKAKQANTTDAKVQFLFEREARHLGHINPPTTQVATSSLAKLFTLRNLFLVLPAVIMLVCVFYVITRCYPRVTFLWGDYEAHYNSLMSIKRTVWTVVVVSLLIGIIGNLFVFGLVDSLRRN